MKDESAPYVPPPPAAAPSREAATAPAAAPEDFISLPPGIADSGTYRLPTPRPARPAPERATAPPTFFAAPPGLAPPAPAAEHEVEADEESADDIDETRLSPPRRAVAAGWRLVLPGGERVNVEAAIFIGRNPAVTAGHPGADLLAVEDPANSLSKTHALIELDEGALWVHDLNSTNGVFIVPPGADDAIRAVPGERAPVAAGAELELGEYVIQVESG